MKIIQISTFFHPVTGGVEIQALEISKKLKEAGHDVVVYTTNSARSKEKITAKESIVDGIPVKRFNTLLSFSQFYKLAPGMLLALLKEDYDVVHVHGFRRFEIYLALIACKVRKKKLVVTTHNPFTTNIRSKQLQKFVDFHDKTFGKWFAKYINKIIALLPSEVKILEEEFNVPTENIVVIPNGIADYFYEGIEVDKNEVLDSLLSEVRTNTETNFEKSKILKKNWNGIVLTVSRLNYVKGLQNLKLAVEKLPKVLFIFVGGDDGYEEDLQVLYRNNKNVVITGNYVPHEKVRELYAIADLFVLPSVHEPFGLTPVEAAASGIPVLATSVGGPKEVLGRDYGKFLDPEDQVAWKEEIERILTDETVREELTKKGLKVAKQYQWGKVIKEIVGVYNLTSSSSPKERRTSSIR